MVSSAQSLLSKLSKKRKFLNLRNFLFFYLQNIWEIAIYIGYYIKNLLEMSDSVHSKKVLGKSLMEILQANKIESIKGLNLKPKKSNNKKNKLKKLY